MSTDINNDQTRLITGAAGGTLLLLALRQRGLLGLCLGAVGGYLAYRAATGKDPVLEAAGLSNIPNAKPIFVEHSITIERKPSEVYDFWRKLENLPQILSHLESVTAIDERRSRWTAKAPLGTSIEWESEIVNDKPAERIGWHSLPGATVDNAGSVQFEQLSDGNTRVHVALSYRPPAGPLGLSVAGLFGDEPNQKIAEDLQKFKARLEGATQAEQAEQAEQSETEPDATEA